MILVIPYSLFLSLIFNLSMAINLIKGKDIVGGHMNLLSDFEEIYYRFMGVTILVAFPLALIVQMIVAISILFRHFYEETAIMRIVDFFDERTKFAHIRMHGIFINGYLLLVHYALILPFAVLYCLVKTLKKCFCKR